MPIRFNGTRDDVVRLIRAVTVAVAGTGPDPLGVARPILTRGAVALLSQIQAAYIVKARGGVGSDGIKWKPLDRKTIAYGRRTSRSELKSLGVSGKRVRGLLTPAQDKKWRSIYARCLAQFRARGVAGGEARAAQIAWAVLKRDGAKTKLDVLGSRVVEIGRDTGGLLASLTPGTEEQPSSADGQIFEVKPGQLTVGSNKPYASRFHASRPMWPAELPQPWADAIAGAIMRGLIVAITRALATGARP
jgi:hypothetical protein